MNPKAKNKAPWFTHYKQVFFQVVISPFLRIHQMGRNNISSMNLKKCINTSTYFEIPRKHIV